MLGFWKTFINESAKVNGIDVMMKEDANISEMYMSADLNELFFVIL